MPPFISPLNQTTASPVAQSKKPLWEQLLDALDEKRPIERLEKQGGVVLSREYNAQRKYAVWIKIYQSVKGNNLSVFNEWEFDLLSRAQNLSVQGCYKSAELVKSGSPIHTGDTPIHLRQSRQTVISTIHGGSDLVDWERMRLRVNRQLVPHPFVEPANFLRLAQGALEALHHLHSQDFVHCDLNPGNLVLPSLIEGKNSATKTVKLRSPHLDKVKITPLWDKLILIDLGYSLSGNMVPYTTLPLDTDVERNPRMSAHLRQRLDNIERQAKRYLSSTKSPKTWENVRFDKTFWSQWKGSPLSLLQKLDWREDLHQLGYLLKDIRDSWGGGEHIKLSNPTLSQLIYSLPEQLLAWGDDTQLDLPAPKEMPHLKLISEIDSALAQAQDKDRQDTFFLYRADHDPDYAARQKSGEERRQHWLRRWRMFRESLARLGQNAWANFFDQHPLLVQLTLSYPVFVFLAIALDKDAIGLPVGGTAALAILIVLGLAVRKLTGLIAYGASRFLMVLVDLLGNLAHSFSIRWRRGWRNAVALWNKLINLIQNAWGYFINRRLLVAFTSFFLFLIVLFGTLSVSGKYPESFRNSIPAAMQIQANPVENLNNPVSSEASARLQKAAETANIERQVYQGKIYFLGKGVSTDLEKGAQWLDKAAAQGDARLKTDIAKLYQKTEHVDYEVKAFDLLQKAATNDFPEAQYELAMAYFLGVGITQSLVEHLYWLQKAANHGVAKAQIELSRYYDSKGNYTQATLWLKKAADQIDPQSQFALSSYYYYLYEKKGGEINKTRAFEFAKKAADQDDASAQGLLAFFYFQGIGVKENQDEALAWATKGDAQENAYAQNVLGGIYNSKGDYKKAFAQFQKAAVQEFPLAQFNLGKCYLDGKGTKPNEAEAMKWFKKAADHNETIAQIELAKMYEKQNNIKEAVYWLQKAATGGGDASAQYSLCNLYHFSKFIETDLYKAFGWCRKAAVQGLMEAQHDLGLMYGQALGTQQDIVRAYAWTMVAANQIDGRGKTDTIKEELAENEKMLTPKQFADAKHLAANWKKGKDL